MKTIITLTFCWFIMIIPTYVNSQILNKDEIKEDLRKDFFLTRDKDHIYTKLNSDSCLSSGLSKFISIIRDQKIDTFGFLQVINNHSSDNHRLSGCKCNNDFYAFLKKGSRYFACKLHCNIEDNLSIEYFELPSLWMLENNYTLMKDEFLYPVIFSATRSSGKIVYDGEIHFHSETYRLYFQMNTEFYWNSFSRDQITNAKSIFYSDNSSTYLVKFFNAFKFEAKSMD